MNLGMQMGMAMQTDDAMEMEIDYGAPRGSRRQRLWEIDPKCHCPIVGVCFDLAQIRKLVARHKIVKPATTDFEIHVTAVRECEARSPLSETLQKDLDRRYTLAIQRFRQARGEERLAELWAEELAQGRMGAALWAVLTHPHCSAGLAQRIYGEVHMLQHQVGAEQRADTNELQTLRHTCAEQAHRLAEREAELAELRNVHGCETERLKQQLHEARANCTRHESNCARYAGELEALRASVPELEKLHQLASRARNAEAQCTALKARVAEQDEALERAQAAIRRLEHELSMQLRGNVEDEHGMDDAPRALAGRNVLCVGGRASAATLYRNMVERLGARFMHHDGGIEENLGRLDATIAAADAVICQAGCISHNAYWRVKEHCKRTGKTCVFLKTPSLSAFLSGLDALRVKPAESAGSEAIAADRA